VKTLIPRAAGRACYVLRVLAGLRAVRAVVRAEVPVDAFAAVDLVLRVDDFAVVDLLAVRAGAFAELFAAVLRVVVFVVFVVFVGVTAARSWSKSLSTVLFVFEASRRRARSDFSSSRYAALLPLPTSEPIACSAVLASSRAFSIRLVAASTCLRVAARFEVEGALADRAVLRAAGFFAGGILCTPYCD
jgi:hypothetical protein